MGDDYDFYMVLSSLKYVIIEEEKSPTLEITLGS